MGKIKFQRFKGIRKRRQTKKIVIREAIEEATSTNEFRPITPSFSTETTSAKKLEAFGLTLESMQDEIVGMESHVQEDNCFLIVSKQCLKKFFVELCCPNCNKTGVIFDTVKGKDMGFCSKAFTYCSLCQSKISEEYLSERVDRTESTQKPFEVNVRSVFAFRGIGCGYNAIKDWASMMNLPNNPSKDAYATAKDKLFIGSGKAFEEVATKSVEVIKDKYKKIGTLPDCNGIVDIAVSYDGSWQRRGGGGHSSHNGVGAVIDVLTGLPIDYEVLCNFCHQCLKAPSADDPNYAEWQENHSLKCSKNYDGTANSMEQECAKRLWNRSVAKYQLRYTTMLSDGDSNAFGSVVEAKPYGNSITIVKEECINHVSKRMGTALVNLQQECKAQKDSISGKGKFTKAKMLKSQNYYGRAIKDNADDIAMMKKRIFAILFHLTSTDENPKHVHCPPGENSWCFWQRAVSKNESSGSHKEHETIPEDVGRKLVPIFQRLTEKHLLKRCIRSKTQNLNESLHGLLWRFCPKITFVGRQMVEIAARMALCQFTKGATFRLTLFKFLGIEPGHHMTEGTLKKSIERLKKACKASSTKAKQRRKTIKYAKTSKEKAKMTKEGKTYQAGLFK